MPRSGLMLWKVRLRKEHSYTDSTYSYSFQWHDPCKLMQELVVYRAGFYCYLMITVQSLPNISHTRMLWMFCCSQVPRFTATFAPHKQDGSCWESNLSATRSKRKQPGSSRTVRAGNSLGITPCLTREKVSKREDEESPKPKSEFRDRIPDYRSSCSLTLNQVAKVVFIEGQVSARNIKPKVHSISSLAAEHAIFSHCNAVPCCNSCASYKMLRAQATGPFTPRTGLWIFSDASLLSCTDL